MRNDTPQVGYAPYRQVHAHSTGNANSTAQNEADYMQRKDLNSGFYTHVVGNGRIIQTAPTNRGAWDVGGGWNNETYAAVELIESHKTKEEFMIDYNIYVDLLRRLATEGCIPTTLDSGDLAGIKTHAYCTTHQPNNGSDHMDPYPYLAKWGISKEQFKKDVEKGMPTENKITNDKEEATMYAIYWKKNTKTGGKDAYFFNGAELKHIPNPNTITVLKTIYRDNNGKNIPEYDWSDGNNPTVGLIEKMFA
ncbi:lytic amidase [Enterococcus cecorum]|uniref:peptidoglycan recognition protein family protein n=1 Tax=Enterococcus cecorum TaxID=44008 RepID=UPI000E139587|nr:lytic amidase [Enterococcus cecorum]